MDRLFSEVYREVKFQNGVTLKGLSKAFPVVPQNELIDILNHHIELSGIYKSGQRYHVTPVDRLERDAYYEYQRHLAAKVNAIPFSTLKEFIDTRSPFKNDHDGRLWCAWNDFDRDRQELQTCARRVSETAERTVARIKDDRGCGYMGINSTGELQGNALSFDILCATINLKHARMMDILISDVELRDEFLSFVANKNS